MANSRKGKIARARWTEIMDRHANGESLASIAREFHCTAPAIKYIVTRRPRAISAAHATDVSDVDRRAAFAATDLKPEQLEPAVITKQIIRSSRPEIIFDNLRTRVTNDIAFFLVALDDAQEHPSAERAELLRQATDNALRSVARVLIHLNRPERQPRRSPVVADASGMAAQGDPGSLSGVC